MAKDAGMELIVHKNQDGVSQNINPFDHGSEIHTDIMKTQALKQALDTHKFDFAFGGARRDEEKSRAKERVLSFRSESHAWDPKNQRPELWDLYNFNKKKFFTKKDLNYLSEKSVSIVGTNGKTSTASILNDLLLNAGLNTCLFTSPHLVQLNERIQINSKLISDLDLAK